MKRTLCIAALAAGLVAAPLAAPAAIILQTLPRPDWPAPAALELRDQHIDVAVRGAIATTTIRQVVHNPNARDAEGVFLVPLPRGAQATELVMEINGRKVAAETLDAAEARRVYTDIVRRTKDPGLLEYLDATTLSLRLFPVPANGDMPVELTLVQPLARDGGAWAYELPAGEATTTRIAGARLTMTVEADSPLASIFSPTHKLATTYGDERRSARVAVEDFEPGDGRGLTVWIAPEAADGVAATMVNHRPLAAADGTFMLRLHPPARVDRTLARSVVFVLDTSGSMAEGNKMAEARAALSQCLGFLEEKDTFSLVAFATSVESLADQPLPATADNIAAARAWLDERQPRGGTNIAGALERALALVDKDRLGQVVFLTDGKPTVGDTEPVQILAIARRNEGPALRVFPLGVGHDVNAPLLDQLAEETRAVPTYIAPGEDIEVRVSNFFETVASPVRRNLALRFEGITTHDVYPLRLPDLFAGRDVAVYGRYTGSGPARAILTGEDAAGPFEAVFELEFADSTGRSTKPVATLWAARRVAFLLEEIRRNGESDELVDEVTQLALEHRLVTPYTSFLAADDADFGPVTREERLRRHEAQVNQILPERRRMLEGVAPVGAAPLGSAKPAAIPQSQSGADAFTFSKNLAEFRAADNVGDDKVGRAAAASVRVIDGVSFERIDGTWVETTPYVKSVAVAVKYLSPAYFALLDRFPEQREAILLGERVTLILGGILVMVGEEGVEQAADLPEGLRPAGSK